jgi:hypothetical protein
MELYDVKTDVAKKFTQSEKDFIARITAIYNREGFDANGLTDLYPTLIKPNDPDGEIELNFWEEFTGKLARKPKLTILTRYTERDIHHDAPSQMMTIDNSWFRVFKGLTLDKIKFPVHGDSTTFNGVLIDHPSAIVRRDGTFSIDERAILADETSGSMWEATEESANLVVTHVMGKATRSAVLISMEDLVGEQGTNAYNIASKATLIPQFQEWLSSSGD